MDAKQAQDNFVIAPQEDGALYKNLLSSNLVLRDGRKVRIMTFLPKGFDFDQYAANINGGLEYDRNVVSVQHDICALSPTGKVVHVGSYHTRYIKHKPLN